MAKRLAERASGRQFQSEPRMYWDVRNRVNREAMYEILLIDRKNKAKEFFMLKKKHSSI